MGNEIQLYSKWKSITEADFVSLFIKTWFAYISTLRTMFPEAQNNRGDGKYLNAFKTHYKKKGYKKLNIDDHIMNPIEILYRSGRKVIMQKYPEYYFWDFYFINEDFNYTYKDIPSDKSDCLVINLKLNHDRRIRRSFSLGGFVKFFGEYYNEKYDGLVKFQVDLTDVISQSESYIRSNSSISEQEYLSWLLHEISVKLSHNIVDSFMHHFSEAKYGKRVLYKVQNIEKHTLSLIWHVFSLNAKDDSLKMKDEMLLQRNTYEIIQQRPINFFEYHMDVTLQPNRELSAFEERWYINLNEEKRQNSILWFLDFVYRLRNALFHEIIDPLDEQWQLIFKNAYLVLKEIVDMNIDAISNNDIYHAH